MAEFCAVCGQEFKLVHDCPGAPPPPEPNRWIAPGGFAPLHYIRQAVAIAKLEDDAIVQASRDEYALFCGGLILATGYLGQLILPNLQVILRQNVFGLMVVAVQLAVLLGVTFITWFLQLGLVHGLARFSLRASGSYIGVVRAMALGSLFTWLLWIPLAGTIIGGFWGVCILMKVFEEVDGIGRLPAFAMSFASGIIAQVFVASFILALNSASLAIAQRVVGPLFRR